MFARKGTTWDRSGQTPSGSGYGMWHKVSNRGNGETRSHEMPLAVLSAKPGESRAGDSRTQSREGNEYELHGLPEADRNRPFAI